MQPQVISIEKQWTAYKKDMRLIYKGVEYRLILHWDTHDGFSMVWLDTEDRFISAPDRLGEDLDSIVMLDKLEVPNKVAS